jgi:hypothetical protein
MMRRMDSRWGRTCGRGQRPEGSDHAISAAGIPRSVICYGPILSRNMDLAKVALAIGMSAGLAEAKGHMAKPKALPYCDMEQQTKATCSCGPGKVMCPKGMWCHTFTSTCTK